MTVGHAPGLTPSHSICPPVCMCEKLYVCACVHAYMSPQQDRILLHIGTPGQSPMAPTGMPPTHKQHYTSQRVGTSTVVAGNLTLKKALTIKCRKLTVNV